MCVCPQQRHGHRVSPLHRSRSRRCHFRTCTLHSHSCPLQRGWGQRTAWPAGDKSMPPGRPDGAEGLASLCQPCLHPHAQPPVAQPSEHAGRRDAGIQFSPQKSFCRVVCDPLLLLTQTWLRHQSLTHSTLLLRGYLCPQQVSGGPCTPCQEPELDPGSPRLLQPGVGSILCSTKELGDPRPWRRGTGPGLPRV